MAWFTKPVKKMTQNETWKEHWSFERRVRAVLPRTSVDMAFVFGEGARISVQDEDGHRPILLSVNRRGWTSDVPDLPQEPILTPSHILKYLKKHKALFRAHIRKNIAEYKVWRQQRDILNQKNRQRAKERRDKELAKEEPTLVPKLESLRSELQKALAHAYEWYDADEEGDEPTCTFLNLLQKVGAPLMKSAKVVYSSRYPGNYLMMRNQDNDPVEVTFERGGLILWKGGTGVLRIWPYKDLDPVEVAKDLKGLLTMACLT